MRTDKSALPQSELRSDGEDSDMDGKAAWRITLPPSESSTEASALCQKRQRRKETDPRSSHHRPVHQNTLRQGDIFFKLSPFLGVFLWGTLIVMVGAFL